MVSEAWGAYVADADAPASVAAFLQWLSENEPDVLRIVAEPVLVAAAERLLARG